MQSNRIFALDFLRAISILMIIFFHYNVSTGALISPDFVLFKYNIFMGTIGVSLFFIISGSSLMITKQDDFRVIHFYIKRFFSIFPLFYFIYTFFVLAYAVILKINLFTATSGRNPLTFLLTLIGLDGLLLYKIPTYYLIGEWFLGCIIILYLMFPLIRYLFAWNKHLCLLASFIVWILIYNYYSLDMPLYSFPLFRVFEFVFGMYYMSIGMRNSAKANIAILATAFLGIVVLFNYDRLISLYVGHITAGLLFFISLSSLSNLVEDFLPNRIIYFVSKYSYAAFLLHHLILNEIISHFKSSISSQNINFVFFLLTVTLIFLIAYVLQNLLRYIIRFPEVVSKSWKI